MGLGSTLVLTTLGGMRELVGQGTLFSQAHLMFGDAAKVLTLDLGEDFHGALVAILPPGAFIGLGLLIALKNLIDQRARHAVRRHAQTAPVTGADPVGSAP